MLFFSGDEDVFAVELVQHLARRGARKFVLASKNKSPSGYETLALKRLKDRNVTVVVSFADPSTAKGVEHLLNEALALGPVCGVYHISTVSVFKKTLFSKSDARTY